MRLQLRQVNPLINETKESSIREPLTTMLRGSLKKSLLVAGLFFVLLGVILVLSSSYVQTNVKTELVWEEIGTEVNKWQISSNLTEGEKVKLVVAPASDWTKESAIPEVPYPHKFVWVNLTDPYGSSSAFEMVFAAPQDPTLLYVYKTELLSSNGFSTNATELAFAEAIVGIPSDTGQYTASIVGSLPQGGSPPTALTFLKEKKTVTTEYEHFDYLLIPGIPMLSVGAFLFLWGARASKRRVSRKRRRYGKQNSLSSLFVSYTWGSEDDL